MTRLAAILPLLFAAFAPGCRDETPPPPPESARLARPEETATLQGVWDAFAGAAAVPDWSAWADRLAPLPRQGTVAFLADWLLRREPDSPVGPLAADLLKRYGLSDDVQQGLEALPNEGAFLEDAIPLVLMGMPADERHAFFARLQAPPGELVDVWIDGEEAFAMLRLKEGERPVRFLKVEGDWRIFDF